MGRKRKSRRDLPERVYQKHGAYFFVKPNGKWDRLGSTLPEALAEYGKMIEPEKLNSMGQIMDRYLAEVVPEKAANTQEYQTRYIRRLREVFGYMKPDEIKPQDIYRYRDIRQKKNGKPTANAEKETLSSIFSKAIEWGLTEKNPCKVVKSFPRQNRDRYITDDEFILLKSNANPDMQCIMDLAYITALRIGDILKIKLSDIQNGDLYVVTEKTKEKLVFKVVGDLDDVINRAKDVRKVLSPYLFADRKGHQIKKNSFGRQFIHLRKKVGLHDKDLCFHDIRGKAATDAEEQGRNAQKLLGHKSRKQTDMYIKQRQIDRIMPLERVKSE